MPRTKQYGRGEGERGRKFWSLPLTNIYPAVKYNGLRIVTYKTFPRSIVLIEQSYISQSMLPVSLELRTTKLEIDIKDRLEEHSHSILLEIHASPHFNSLTIEPSFTPATSNLYRD